MAKVTVTYKSAVDVLSNTLISEERYRFNEISDILKDNFKGINNSQISGLIFRLSNGEDSFLSKYTASDQPNYFYSLNENWNENRAVVNNLNNINEYSRYELEILINNLLDSNIKQLNEYKSKINEISDFGWIQEKINTFESMKSNIDSNE